MVNSKACHDAMETNDSPYTDDAHKERYLMGVFAYHGDELEFVDGKYPENA